MATRSRVVRFVRAAAFVLGGLAVLILYGLFLWRAPEFLVNQELMRRLSPEQRLPVEHNARLIVISVGGALVVGTGLLYTARNYRLAHRGQVTERFTKALERLGSDELYVRIGGVHALEHVMRDSPEHHGDVVEVLITFIRDRVPRKVAESVDEALWMHPPSGTDKPELPAEPAPDVQAALTALGSRPKRIKYERVALNFRQLHIQGVHLTGAQFRDADLRGADLQNADLSRADLQNADLREANLQNADLSRADLQKADLIRADLQNAYLAMAKLQNADLREANLQKADLIGAKLQTADLSGADVQNAYLSGAKLQKAYLRGADLQNAHLVTAKLQKTNLIGAKLQNADLSGAKLQNACLREAHLQNADLSGAKLQNADLREAHLQNANLHGADLSLAALTAEQLRQAVLSERSVLPEGLMRGSSGEIWEKKLS